MSVRTNLRPHSVITNGDMSADITSQVTVLQSITELAYAIAWSGTSPVGTLSVQLSNDYRLDASGAVENSGTWTTMTLNDAGTPVTSIPISGNSGSKVVDIKTSAYAARLFYDATSGVGTMQAIVTGKVS